MTLICLLQGDTDDDDGRSGQWLCYIYTNQNRGKSHTDVITIPLWVVNNVKPPVTGSP